LTLKSKLSTVQTVSSSVLYLPCSTEFCYVEVCQGAVSIVMLVPDIIWYNHLCVLQLPFLHYAILLYITTQRLNAFLQVTLCMVVEISEGFQGTCCTHLQCTKGSAFISHHTTSHPKKKRLSHCRHKLLSRKIITILQYSLSPFIPRTHL
jgi:hypothetical protein